MTSFAVYKSRVSLPPVSGTAGEDRTMKGEKERESESEKVAAKGRQIEREKKREKGEKGREILSVRDYVNWPSSHSNRGKDAFSRRVDRRRKVSRDGS